MNPDDRKLTLLAVATAVGGGYLTKLALDHALGEVPEAVRQEERARATAVEHGALSDALTFAVTCGLSIWMLSEASDWVAQQMKAS